MPNRIQKNLTPWGLASRDATLAGEIWADLLKAAYTVLEQPGRRTAIRRHARIWLDRGTDDEMATLLADNFFDKFGSIEIPTNSTGEDIRSAWRRFIDAPWTDLPMVRNGVSQRRPSRIEYIANAAGRDQNPETIPLALNAKGADRIQAEVEQTIVSNDPSAEEIDAHRLEQISQLAAALKKKMSGKEGDRRFQQQIMIAISLQEILFQIASSSHIQRVPDDLLKDNLEPNKLAIARWLGSLGIKTSDKTAGKVFQFLTDALRRKEPVPDGGDSDV